MHVRMFAVTAAAVLLVGLAPAASAAPIDKGHFNEAGSEDDPTFCGVNTRFAWDFDVNYLLNVRKGTPYYSETVHGWNSITNLETGRSYTHVFNDASHDVEVTDNGDGTVTIVVSAAGGDRWYDADGKLFLRDPGHVVFAFRYGDNGTPDDDSDDIDEFLGFLKESTGLNETDGRDFCEDYLLVTG